MVTITGADDAVEPIALVELSREFPFVEWGVLRSDSRDGTPRYPSLGWRAELLNYITVENGGPINRSPVNLSMHLCGQMARDAMSGDASRLSGEYRRVQLNGWSRYQLPALLLAKRYPQIEFIAQATCESAFCDAAIFITRCEYQNMSVLFDPSGGRGVEIDRFPTRFDPAKIGYAGGISQVNVRDLLDRLAVKNQVPTWIDMESGVRTDDCFDLDKVRTVLELCKPYVVAKGRAA